MQLMTYFAVLITIFIYALAPPTPPMQQKKGTLPNLLMQ
jgi:hypothetical protein